MSNIITTPGLNYTAEQITDMYNRNIKLELLKDYNLAKYLDPNNFVMVGAAKTFKDALQTNFAFTSPADTQLLKSFKSEGWSGRHLASAIDDKDMEMAHYNTYDTSLGGGEAVNSRWGFNHDDDIIHPINAVRGNPKLGGLGRVYFENYHCTQHTLLITVGVPEFMEMYKFYQSCMDGNLANTINSGEGSLMKDLGGWIGSALVFTTKLALFPKLYAGYLAGSTVSGWLGELSNWFSNGPQVTRYYEIKPAMAMYHKYVNMIFARLVTMMGMDGGLSISNSATDQGTVTLGDQYGGGGSLPGFLQHGGLSVETILSKRNTYYNQSFANEAPMEDYIDRDQTIETSSRRGEKGDAFGEIIAHKATGADKYIGFRINKNTDASESISNASGQSTIASTLNAAASAGKDARFNMSGGIDNIFKVAVIGDILGGAKDLLTGLVNSVGLGSLATTVMTGSGFIDIPDVWTSSNFTKNHSFSMTFRAASGNDATIIQDCYVPLALILGFSCPRTIGRNSYTAPFIVRAYSRGMFAIPIGLVESLSITRGASEFGWNTNKLPTVINVSMSIKDLTPIMHLALNESSFGFQLSEVNTTSMSYFQALSGLGPREALDRWYAVLRRKKMFKYTWGQIFSPYVIASKIADMPIVSAIPTITAKIQRGS